MIHLNTPLSEKDILSLNAGDLVLLNGTVFTARDKAHKYLLENNLETIKNSVIYHCGPIIKDNKVIAAGPTTSSRVNPYTPELIEKYSIKAIIGKGGMNNSVLTAIKGRAVYLSAVGGAALIYAKNTKIKNVYKKEFGMPEAIWELEVKDFPLTVTMDSKGKSIYADIYQKSKNIFLKLTNPINKPTITQNNNLISKLAEYETKWWQAHHRKNTESMTHNMAKLYELQFNIPYKKALEAVESRVKAGQEHDIAEMLEDKKDTE